MQDHADWLLQNEPPGPAVGKQSSRMAQYKHTPLEGTQNRATNMSKWQET